MSLVSVRCAIRVLVLSLAAAATSTTPAPAQQSISIRAPGGDSIAADEYGTGPRAVVLAHGGRFDKGSWKDQAVTLAKAGFQVVAIDFRAAVQTRAGIGSPCLYDPECLAIDVLAAVRYLRQGGATSVAVVGGSLGGGAAAQASVVADSGEIDQVVLLAAMSIEHPERMKGRKLFITTRYDTGRGTSPGSVPSAISTRERRRRRN